MPVKPGRKAVYHLPVVFGTLFFLPLEYLFTVYISKLVMVGDRDRNCIHPSKKIIFCFFRVFVNIYVNMSRKMGEGRVKLPTIPINSLNMVSSLYSLP